ncbi:hypothetical protein ACFQET_08910 [Levilactobacillus tangyuanensis]|uniref:Uncharacterized protein n=1 Tax=Levilactobacillus tangyuanensis TaxID=2486021 RepID=A0ABW1TRL5_9LACO|nr:hypothetical protein [Levilactobacillus tangyuanensis]
MRVDMNGRFFMLKGDLYSIVFNTFSGEFMLVNISTQKVEATGKSFRRMRELLDYLGAKTTEIAFEAAE